MNSTNEVHRDVIIAGAGPAGILAALRLNAFNPALRIIVLEKEPTPGGRLRAFADNQPRWGYGLNSISPELYEFWDQTFKMDPEAPDLPSLAPPRQETIGVLAAGRVSEVGVDEAFSVKGARAIAGAAAARDWKNVDKILADVGDGQGKDHVFSGVWSGTRQSPAAIALDHLAHTYGIADLWSVSTHSLVERAHAVGMKRYSGNWDKAFAFAVQRFADCDNVELRLNCRIFGGSKTDAGWQLATEQGDIQAGALIVAQSPWEAIDWLPKNLWPSQLLTVAIKAKPTSAVILSEHSETPEVKLPDLVLIPAEGVQASVSDNGEISYQVTLDYEISMQAPDVVKAVKRLKRARKKLHATYPNLKTTGEHLALLSVGWAQPTGFHDRRLVEKLDRGATTSATLAFCGDAYGPSSDGDKNFISSLLAACEVVGTSASESRP